MLRPSPTATAAVTPVAVRLVSTPSPDLGQTLAAPRSGDLILRFANDAFRLWREGGGLEPARLADFNHNFRDPAIIRVQQGDQFLSFPLILLPEHRAVRLIRPAGDGPSKEVMYSDDRHKRFMVGTLAGSDWGYAAVIQSNGRDLELFFGEPAGDHHQGAARQMLPPWIQTVRRMFWQGDNILMIVRTSEGRFGLVRIVPGAKRNLPPDLARDAWSASHELSEPLMKYNKSLWRDYSPLWIGDDEIIDLAIVK